MFKGYKEPQAIRDRKYNKKKSREYKLSEGFCYYYSRQSKRRK